MTRLVVAIVVLLAAAPAAAQDTSAPTTQPLTVRGVSGTWFPRESADRLMRDVEALRSYRDVQVPRLEDRLRLEMERSTLLLSNLRLTEQVARIWRESFERFVRAHVRLEPHWYEAPVFWFTVGVLGTGLLAVGLAFGLNQGT